MVLIFHIVVALAGLGISAYLMFRPGRSLLRTSYTLTGLTLATGTVLVAQGAGMLHMCLSGLLYCSLVAVATEVARRRLRMISTNV